MSDLINPFIVPYLREFENYGANVFNNKLNILCEHTNAITMQITESNIVKISNTSNLTVNISFYSMLTSKILKYLNYLPSSIMLVKSIVTNLNKKTMRNLPNKVQVVDLKMCSHINIYNNKKIKLPRNIYLIINRGKVKNWHDDTKLRDYIFKTDTLGTLFHYERSGKKIYNKN